MAPIFVGLSGFRSVGRRVGRLWLGLLVRFMKIN
jgi:hypothetical protein